jgi:RNA polymerase sigma factor (sigma-70 family)
MRSASCLPREYLELAERIVRDYPARLRERALVEQAVTAMCHARGLGTTGGGGQPPEGSEPERIAEALEANGNYRRLSKGCAFIATALTQLSEEERTVVRLAFWENCPNRKIAETLRVEERTARRFKSRILKKLIRVFLRPAITGLTEVKLSSPGQGVS